MHWIFFFTEDALSWFGFPPPCHSNEECSNNWLCPSEGHCTGHYPFKHCECLGNVSKMYLQTKSKNGSPFLFTLFIHFQKVRQHPLIYIIQDKCVVCFSYVATTLCFNSFCHVFNCMINVPNHPLIQLHLVRAFALHAEEDFKIPVTTGPSR